jgi:hypothetical protein
MGALSSRTLEAKGNQCVMILKALSRNRGDLLDEA